MLPRPIRRAARARDRALALARAFARARENDRAPGALGEKAAALALATLSAPEAAADALEAALGLGGGDARAAMRLSSSAPESGEAIATVVDNAAAILDQRRIQSDDGAPQLDFADEGAHAAAAQVHAWCRARGGAALPRGSHARRRTRPSPRRAAAGAFVPRERASRPQHSSTSTRWIERRGLRRRRRRDDDSSSEMAAVTFSARAPASNSARKEAAKLRRPTTTAPCDDTDADRADTDTMALRRSLEGSQVALRRLAADLGSTNTTVAPLAAAAASTTRARARAGYHRRRLWTSRRRATTSPSRGAGDPRSPRPDRSPAFAASIKRPAFFADDEEAFRPGGPVQRYAAPVAGPARGLRRRLRRGRDR